MYEKYMNRLDFLNDLHDSGDHIILDNYDDLVGFDQNNRDQLIGYLIAENLAFRLKANLLEQTALDLETKLRNTLREWKDNEIKVNYNCVEYLKKFFEVHHIGDDPVFKETISQLDEIIYGKGKTLPENNNKSSKIIWDDVMDKEFGANT